MRFPLWSVALLIVPAACGGPEPNTRSVDPYERYLGEKELTGRTDAATMAQIVGMLEDPHYLVVVGAMEVLCSEGRPEFLQHIVPKLKHKHPMVRQYACSSIAALKNPEGIPALIETLKDADPSVRRSAVKALGTFGKRPDVVAALVETVGEKDPSVAYMAHLTLSELTGRADVARTKEAWAAATR